MSLADWISALDEAGLAVGPDELADALWLAVHSFTDLPEIVPRTDDVWPMTGASSAEESSPGSDPAYVSILEPGPSTEILAQWTNDQRPYVSVTPNDGGHRRLAKDLKPLRRRRRRGLSDVLDESATAERSASVGIVLPEFLPEWEPFFDVHLAADTSGVMDLWEGDRLALRRTLTDSGIFRRVSDSQFEPDPDTDVARLVSHRGTQGQTVFLIFTDGTAPYWHTENAERLFTAAAKRGPVAVVQPLPESMWSRTGLRPRQGSLRALSPKPGALAEFRLAGGRASPIPGPAVPIWGLRGKRIAPWASFVSGRGASLNGPMYLPAGGQARAVAAEDVVRDCASSSAGNRDPVRADDPLAAFAEIASPLAQLLACHLAVCSRINLPVIRSVQAMALPESGPAHVAEVLLGGLLTIVDEGGSGHSRWVYPDAIQASLAARLPLELASWLHLHVTTMVEREAGRRGADPGGAAESGLTSVIRYQIESRQTITPEPEPVDDRPGQAVGDDQDADLIQRLGRCRMAAASLSPDDPAWRAALLDVAEAELAAFGKTDRSAHLDEAISTLRRVFSTFTPDQSEPWILLAETLVTRADRQRADHVEAAREDAREAVEMYRRLLVQGQDGALPEADEVRVRAGAVRAGTLAGSLNGDKVAHDFAVRQARALVAEFPPGHPDYPQRAAGLAGALRQRYTVTQSSADLNESLLFWMAAVEGSHGPERIDYLLGRGSALEARYETSRSLSDLATASSCYQEASRVVGVGAEQQAVALSGLARALSASGRRPRAERAAQEALTIFERLGAYRHPDALWARALLNESSAGRDH